MTSGQIILAALGATFGTAALGEQAGGWDVFVARCLQPVKTGTLAQPSDLALTASYKNDGDTFSAYALPGGGAELRVSDGTNGHPQWCSMAADGPIGQQMANGFMDWVQGVDMQDGYQVFPGRERMAVRRAPSGQDAGFDVVMIPHWETTRFVLQAAQTGAQPATHGR